MNAAVKVEESPETLVEAVINTSYGPWFLQFAPSDTEGQVRLRMKFGSHNGAMNISPDQVEDFAAELVKLAAEVRA